jgi:hypothetical protein
MQPASAITTPEAAVAHARQLVTNLLALAPHQKPMKVAMAWAARVTRRLAPSRIKALYYGEVPRPAFDEVALLQATLDQQLQRRRAFDVTAIQLRLDGQQAQLDQVRSAIAHSLSILNGTERSDDDVPETDPKGAVAHEPGLTPDAEPLVGAEAQPVSPVGVSRPAHKR